ncbi:hypothetical protein L1887_60621 [Cichorium endivia]|nr:hypothetical protein L1887_60621 [Cichorium endivia]
MNDPPPGNTVCMRLHPESPRAPPPRAGRIVRLSQRFGSIFRHCVGDPRLSFTLRSSHDSGTRDAVQEPKLPFRKLQRELRVSVMNTQRAWECASSARDVAEFGRTLGARLRALGLGNVIEGKAVGQDERRIKLARHDKLFEHLLHVLLHGSLAVALERDALLHEGANEEAAAVACVIGDDADAAALAILGLGARISAEQVRVSEDAADLAAVELLHPAAPVGAVAHGEFLLLAVVAATARHRERGDHAVALLEFGHLGADLVDHTDTFVAEDLAFVDVGHIAVVEVQVATAHRDARSAHNDVGRVGDGGSGHVDDAHIALALPRERVHIRLARLVARRRRSGLGSVVRSSGGHADDFSWGSFRRWCCLSEVEIGTEECRELRGKGGRCNVGGGRAYISRLACAGHRSTEPAVEPPPSAPSLLRAVDQLDSRPRHLLLQQQEGCDSGQ